MARFFKFVGGLMMGFAAGAAVMALLTPQSGTQVQDGLRHHVDNAVEEGRVAADAKRAELEGRAGFPTP